MKRWVAGLLLANLVLAIYFVNRNPAPPAMPELAPERIRLVERAPLPQAVTRTPSAERVTGTSAAPQCRRWQGLERADYAAALAALKTLSGTVPLSFREVPRSTRHWVVYPPLVDAAATRARIAELTQMGVTDVLPVRDGPWRNGISLGLYATAAAAAHRVEQIRKLGVEGARVELLPRQGTAYDLDIRSDEAAALAQVETLVREQGRGKLVPVDCP